MNPIQKEKKQLKNKIAKQDSLNKKMGEHGVTIMALVITIIVLLILAGITIQMSLNDNGIIKQAQRAKNIYESSRDEEQSSLGQISNAIQDAMNSTSGSSGGSEGSSGGGSGSDQSDLQDQIDKLKQENENLKNENNGLKDENDELKKANDDLKSKQATGNATPEQVLSGATFSTASKIGQTGSMPINEGSDNVKNDKAWTYNNRVYLGIPYGYYPSGTFGGLENVSERYITFASLANAVGLTNTKLAVGQNVLGVNGTFTSDATASADNLSNGKIAYVNGQKIVGTGANESNNYNSGFVSGMSAWIGGSTANSTVCSSAGGNIAGNNRWSDSWSQSFNFNQNYTVPTKANGGVLYALQITNRQQGHQAYGESYSGSGSYTVKNLNGSVISTRSYTANGDPIVTDNNTIDFLATPYTASNDSIIVNIAASGQIGRQNTAADGQAYVTMLFDVVAKYKIPAQ